MDNKRAFKPIRRRYLSTTFSICSFHPRYDIVAQDFGVPSKVLQLFDIRVFNHLAPSLLTTAPPALFRQKEWEKRRMYEERIREVEQGLFTPPVFSQSHSGGSLQETCINDSSPSEEELLNYHHFH